LSWRQTLSPVVAGKKRKRKTLERTTEGRERKRERNRKQNNKAIANYVVQGV
jgi:hypothetical protein